MISAREAVENAKIGWNLGNALDCYSNTVNPSASGIDSGKMENYETAWGNPATTKELIHYVKSCGFQGIRIPVTWGENLDEDGNVKSAWMAHVKKIVGWVLDEGFYVILNVHHDTGVKGWLRATKESFDKYKNRYIKLWTQIANEFESASEKLMFESFNEMLDGALGDGTTESGNWRETTDEGFDFINKWNQVFVDTVRATGGNNAERNLICNTYSAGHEPIKVADFVMPKDTVQNHLICEVHNYNVKSAELDDDFLRIAVFGEKLGCPVIIGEWGSSNDNSGSEWFSYVPTEEERAEHAKTFVSLSTKRGLACYYWDDGKAYQLIDREKYSSVQKKVLDAIVNNVSQTVPLTDAEKNITEITNLRKVDFTIDDDLKFSWKTKPEIIGDTTGSIAFGIFKTDWSAVYLWLEESYADLSDGQDLLERMITWEHGVSSKSELPEKVYFQLLYKFGNDKQLKIVELKELTIKK